MMQATARASSRHGCTEGKAGWKERMASGGKGRARTPLGRPHASGPAEAGYPPQPPASPGTAGLRHVPRLLDGVGFRIFPQKPRVIWAVP